MTKKKLDKVLVRGYAFYAFLNKPKKNPMKEDKLEYSLCLVADEASHKTLQKLGLNVSNQKDKKTPKNFKDLENGKKGPVYSFKANTEIDGEEIDPPKVVDSKNKEFTGVIGNGSKVVVRLAPYEHKFGISARIEAVQVLELIPFTHTRGSFEPFEEAEGFVASDDAKNSVSETDFESVFDEQTGEEESAPDFE